MTMRRVMAIAVITTSALMVGVPAFASGIVDQVKDTVNNACQNVADGPGSCPHI